MYWVADYASALVLVLAVAIPIGALYKSLGVVRFAIFVCAAFVIQLPAWALYVGRNDCVGLTGDPSCVAGPGWAISLYQIIALPLIYTAWRLLRRGVQKAPTP